MPPPLPGMGYAETSLRYQNMQGSQLQQGLYHRQQHAVLQLALRSAEAGNWSTAGAAVPLELWSNDNGNGVF